MSLWMEEWLGWGALVVSWLRLMPSDLKSQCSSPAIVRAFFSLSLYLTPVPCSLLSSTSSNEEVFHRIHRRWRKAIGPGGPGSISLRLFHVLVSHYCSGVPERVNKQTKNEHTNSKPTIICAESAASRKPIRFPCIYHSIISYSCTWAHVK